jgi:enterochelin esterase family protein
MNLARALIVPVLLAAPCVAGPSPGAPAPPRDPRPGTASGRLEARVVDDTCFHRPRRLWVCTPPGYDARRAEPYPLIVAFDGDEYRVEMPLPRVLDTLLAAGRAPAFVALLVDDSTGAARIADLGNARRMVDFLGGQVVPWLRRGWRVTSDPRRVIVTGSSAGGLAAAFVAFSRPDLFGNVWSQSGAFWRGAEGSNGPPFEWLTRQIEASPRRDVRFVLEVGEGEHHATIGGQGPVFDDAHRRFAEALAAKGYEVTSTTVPGGQHSPGTWGPRLAGGIEALCARWPRPW